MKSIFSIPTHSDSIPSSNFYSWIKGILEDKDISGISLSELDLVSGTVLSDDEMDIDKETFYRDKLPPSKLPILIIGMVRKAMIDVGAESDNGNYLLVMDDHPTNGFNIHVSLDDGMLYPKLRMNFMFSQ